LRGEIVCICRLSEVRKSHKRLDPQIANLQSDTFGEQFLRNLFAERPPFGRYSNSAYSTIRSCLRIKLFQGLFSKKIYNVEYNPRAKPIKWYLLIDLAAFLRCCLVRTMQLCIRTASAGRGGGRGAGESWRFYSLCDVCIG
jgi:hypothetical protein